MTSNVEWRWWAWEHLPPDVLYGFLKLRSDIFVVEQNCVFSDMDGVDRHCEHLCAHGRDGAVLAYLRLVPPGVNFAEASLGRLVVARIRSRFPGAPVRIGGQRYLEAFYGSLGFRTTGEPYLEDGIPHVDMLWRDLYSPT
jgi:ElaA protein